MEMCFHALAFEIEWQNDLFEILILILVEQILMYYEIIHCRINQNIVLHKCYEWRGQLNQGI